MRSVSFDWDTAAVPCACQPKTINTKKMSGNLLISIAVITFVTIFLVALGVVIIVLIMQYVNDKKKKKDLLMKVSYFLI